MAKRKIYNSILDKPLQPYSLYEPLKKIGFFNEKDQFIQNLYQKEIRERENALYEYFGLKRPKHIDPTTQQLIKQMAIKLGFIGFTEKGDIKKPGKPSKWNDIYGLIFFLRVKSQLYKKPNIPLRQAIDIVRRQHYKDSLDTLYTRYSELQKNKNSLGYFIYILLKNIFSAKGYTDESKSIAYGYIAEHFNNTEL